MYSEPKNFGRLSKSSLNRWCDLPSQRTVGGHSRIAIPVVVRFLRENQREVVRPDILGLPGQTHRSATILRRSIQLLSEALESPEQVRFSAR